MSDESGKTLLGLPSAGPGRAETIAAGASLAWLLVAGLIMLLGSGGFASVVLTLVVPVALLWVGLFAAHSARAAREETHRLRAEIETLHRSIRTQTRNGGLAPELDRRLAAIERAARQTEAALIGFGVARPEPEAGPAPQREEEPEAGETGEPDPPQPSTLSRAEMAKALNFPDNDQDREGFAALRAALKDHRARQLIQASQDVLTLLSQDGIYMDDLTPESAPPDAWRRFAQGARGAAVSELAGVRDEAFCEIAAQRMKSDTIFRDAAHHFLRLFDRMLVEYADGAEDDEIVVLSETRTGRAFMLLGQATGNFD